MRTTKERSSAELCLGFYFTCIQAYSRENRKTLNEKKEKKNIEICKRGTMGLICFMYESKVQDVFIRLNYCDERCEAHAMSERSYREKGWRLKELGHILTRCCKQKFFINVIYIKDQNLDL